MSQAKRGTATCARAEKWKRLAAGVALVLAALSHGAVTSAQEARDLTLEEVERAFLRVAEAVRPSVVSVSARLSVPLPGGGADESAPGEAEATYDVYMSGVLTGPDGEVVTLRRGLADARLVQVTLADGRVLPARHVATDDLTAIALVKILDPPRDLCPIRPARGKVRPGALIVAVGNPYGFANSVSYGNVSGVERVVGSHAYTGLLQITAPINPGDQGGLVADARGEAIGLVASTYRRALTSPLSAEALGRMVEQQVHSLLGRFLREGLTIPPIPPIPRSPGRPEAPETGRGATAEVPSGARDVVDLERLLPLIKHHAEAGQGLLTTQGIHFALPMDFVLDIARRLREGETIPRGWLGVRVSAMDPMSAYLLGADGVLVQEVAEGGPAAGGGLRPGDVIVGFGGLPVAAPGALRRLVLVGGGAPVGSPVAVEIIRGSERLVLRVVLEPLAGGEDPEGPDEGEGR